MKIEDIDKQIGMPDVEHEWAKFNREVIECEEAPAIRPQRVGGWHRAAVIALICSLGFVALASVVYVGFIRSGEVQNSAVATENVVEQASVPNVLEALDDTFVFDDVELQNIVSELASYYGVEMAIENNEAAHIRLYVALDKSMTLDEIVEYLNNLQGVNLSLEAGRLIVR